MSASNQTIDSGTSRDIGTSRDQGTERWQHLLHHTQTRVCTLQHTLLSVQQLEESVQKLRLWLRLTEDQLHLPVLYSHVHQEEILTRLRENQVLQRTIEGHSDLVSSVLSLCEGLLHDADACCSDSESDLFTQTMKILDQRWRNICAMSVERRLRIEETWSLWSKFLEDFSGLDQWLTASELTAKNPESENVLYTSAKQELRRFQVLQRQVHERLTHLELLNKLYQRLSVDQRTDAAHSLRTMVEEMNQRWDQLQTRVHAVIRRLKHFTSQREELEEAREAILVWLTHMDLTLTDVEHFSEGDWGEKRRQLQVFQQQIVTHTEQIDALIVFGEVLIQKSCPQDAALMEEELQELHSYCQEVFRRVARFHLRLSTQQPPTLTQPPTRTQPPLFHTRLSDSDLDSASDLGHSLSWSETKRRRRRRSRRRSRKVEGPALLAPPPERGGRDTPVSVESIPLEWDHTVDVGGSSSQEEEEQEEEQEQEESIFSTFSVKSLKEPQKQQSLEPPDSAPCGERYLSSESSSSKINPIRLILNDNDEPQVDRSTGRSDVPQQLTSDLCDVTSWLGRVQLELGHLQSVGVASVQELELQVQRLQHPLIPLRYPRPPPTAPPPPTPTSADPPIRRLPGQWDGVWDLSSVGNDDTDSDGSESEAPHFTLQELRDVLYEKNQLKAQVLVLQEELAYYKQESDEDYSESVCGPYEDNTDSAAAAEEEPESGIRKLIFTAIMPMVAAGLISDDPALMPIRRLVSIS
uniref:RH2 domain-containing protein n=1 Tax=Knipowitschia caucasica TaxID=637954 RepID=A0AAV2JHK4_KNICA